MSRLAALKLEVGINAISGEVLEEEFAELIAGYEAGIEAFSAELVHSDNCISRRASAGKLAFLHVDGFHEFLLPLLIHQGHDTLFHSILFKEIRTHFRNDIHDGIADAINIILHSIRFRPQNKEKETQATPTFCRTGARSF